jgi:hypothetical protein
MQPVSPEFCSWDDESGSCNWIDYAQSISIVALPSFAIGVLCTLVVSILFCVRCCCLRKRCCGLPWRGTTSESVLLSAGLVIISLFFLGLIGLGVLGNVWSHMGITDTSDAASGFSHTVINITEDAAALLEQISSDYGQQMNDSLSMAQDVQDNIDSILDILRKAELARFLFFLVIYAGLLLVVLATFVIVFIFRSFLFCINFWYGWFLFIFIFLSLTLCVTVGTVVSDVCDVYDHAQYGNTSNVFTQFMGSGWGDNCSAMADVIAPLFQEYNNSVQDGCSYYASLCSDPSSGVSHCMACDEASNKTELIHTTIVDEVIYCGTSSEQYCPSNAVCSSCSGCACYNRTQTIDECSTECLDPSYRDGASQMVTYASLMTQLDEMIDRVTPYAGCQLITRFVEATTEPLCVEYLSGDFLLVLSAIGICVFWIFYQLLLLLAYERSKLAIDEAGDDNKSDYELS